MMKNHKRGKSINVSINKKINESLYGSRQD